MCNCSEPNSSPATTRNPEPGVPESDCSYKDKKAINVVVLGQFPPPVHGQSMAIQLLCQASWPDVRLFPVPLTMSTLQNEVGKFSWKKLFRIWHVRNTARQVLHEHSPCILYYPPAPPALLPFLRDCVLLGSLRRHSAATVLHFHAGGLGHYVCRYKWRKWIGRSLFGADCAVHAGPSCPPDGPMLEAKRVEIIPGAVPDPGKRANPPERKEADLLRVLYVGHLKEQKGLDLLPAIARAMKSPAQFDVLGEWASEHDRDTYEKELLSAGIVVHGGVFNEAKWRFFEQAHVLLFPSRVETQGLVAVEALACGLPVVASDIPGIQDVITNGSEGYLVALNDAEGFACALEKLRHPPTWQAISHSARSRYESRFKPEKHYQQWRKLFVNVSERM